MKESMHEQAERLITASRVEGVSPADREWLDRHLEGCTACAQRAAAVDDLVRSFRSLPVRVDPGVVRSTQLRVRLRARELREHQIRMRALWVSCALSWISGAVTAPLLWRGSEWIGQHMALPQAVWITAFILWWTVPAAVVAAVLVWRRSRVANENSYATTEPRWKLL